MIVCGWSIREKKKKLQVPGRREEGTQVKQAEKSVWCYAEEKPEVGSDPLGCRFGSVKCMIVR